MPITATATVAPPPSYPHEILKTPTLDTGPAGYTRTVAPVRPDS